MTAAETAQQLQQARQRWRAANSPSRTVWDEVVESQGDATFAAWTDALAGMGVALLAYSPERSPALLPVARCVRLAPAGGGAQPVVVMPDPWDEDMVGKLAFILGTVPLIATASGRDLGRWIQDAGGPEHVTAPRAGRELESSPAEDGVVQFVDHALASAIALGSSDIHFETDRHGLRVKHRIDGVLRDGGRLPSVQRAEEAISRIKVLAKLDITERRVPQDGRFRYQLDAGASMDLRVSIMPSVHGEDAVLRLLDRAQLRESEAAASLDALQFDVASVERIRDLAQLPHGMLLVTGPTGSGKTTTVYGILSELNNGEEKIVTIEDPVEYELPGVLQIPVNERKGLTFAKGLRSILRHDPDRILVGEIRDADTAEIAVQSALTGHQVFTTVHANSLFDVTGRFRHFGLDMFGFTAALNGVVVQRLVRALCLHCKGERAASERERQWMAAQGHADVQRLPVAIGCPACNGTGYRRRFVLAEVHRIDDVMRDLITGQHAISALRAHVASSGVPPLTERAAASVAAGTTTFEEIRRVVGLA